jgi:signal transduction histidine kinase/DNA-binding NarL/FixJ family response regulator
MTAVAERPPLEDAVESRRIARLERLRVLDTGGEPVLDGITRLAAELTGRPIALISLVDRDRQWFKSTVGVPQGGQTPRAIAFCTHAIQGDGLFEVEDARADPRFAGTPLVTGKPHVVHYAAHPLVMPGGERIGALCVIGHEPGRLSPQQANTLGALARSAVDVLLLREEQQDLREQLQHRAETENALLHAVIEHLPAGLTVFGADERHVISNQLVRQMMAVPEQIFNAPDADFRSICLYLARRGDYGPGDPEVLAQRRVEAAMASSGHHSDRRLPDGRIVEVRGNAVPGGYFVATYTDVTATRRATQELNSHREQLARALGAADAGLWDWNTATGQVYLSGRLSELLGLPAEDRIADADDILRLVPEGERPHLLAAQRELLRGGTPRFAEEHSVRGAGGERVWLLSEGQVAERSPEGRALRVVGISRNVTQRRRADEALRRALDAAGEASRAKSDFLATMSHEIRTPINGVIGLAQLLQGAQLPARECGYVAMIHSCAKSLLGLVDNVLDFSKIEAGKLTLRESQSDLPALVREVADVVTVRAAEKDIAFTVQMAPGVPSAALLDAVRLKQILLNLLGNACKFTHAGGVSLRVDVAGAGAERKLRFAVTDTGIGIAEADQARLFTRFTQADASVRRRYQGTGLGLAISRELAWLMGGDVHLESRAGVGSTFTLELPLREAQPVAAREERAGPSVRVDAQILLVEDNEVNRVVAKGLLAGLGYMRVASAENGLEALDACERRDFDLVLMDCQMPEMDGLRATMELRKRGVDTPIIALTAHAMAGDRERCLMAGMNDYLTKPIEPRLLGEKLAQWLGSGDAGDAAPAAPAPAPRVEPYEAGTLQNRFMGNQPLWEQSRRMFLDRAGPALQSIADAAAAGNAKGVAEAAHKLKGTAGTVGAPRVASICAKAEAEGLAADVVVEWLNAAQAEVAAYERASADSVIPASV